MRDGLTPADAECQICGSELMNALGAKRALADVGWKCLLPPIANPRNDRSSAETAKSNFVEFSQAFVRVPAHGHPALTRETSRRMSIVPPPLSNMRRNDPYSRTLRPGLR